ncbi:MAG: hypothetical protein SF172_03375 [Burkholderiales bacterium]|nr:hypothetical protein [Burkholderiales bacterium]
MKASPGDYGIDGFTLDSGLAFQCYCPEKHYSRPELYEKQRDKITEDVGKLRTHQKPILDRVGSNKFSKWIFLTPEYDKNDLLAHARSKEVEVRSWNLPFLTSDFQIVIRDASDYRTEINEIRVLSLEPLYFEDEVPTLKTIQGEKEEHEKNIERKSKARLAGAEQSPRYSTRLEQLRQKTLESFFEYEDFFRKISDDAPLIYVRLVRLINEYEEMVVESSTTWSGTAQDLTEKIRDDLASRISQELAPQISAATAMKIARIMTARWIAVCELDYG